MWCILRVRFWVQCCLVSLSSASLLRWKRRRYPQQLCRKRWTGRVTDRRGEVQYGGTLRHWRMVLQKTRELNKKYAEFCRWGEIAPCSIQSRRGLAEEQRYWKELEVSSGCQIESKVTLQIKQATCWFALGSALSVDWGKICHPLFPAGRFMLSSKGNVVMAF